MVKSSAKYSERESKKLQARLDASCRKRLRINLQKVKASPSDFDLNLTIGIDYTLLKQEEKALKYLKCASKVKPSDAPACYWLGSCYLTLKEYTRARSILTKARKINPRDRYMKHCLARTFSELAAQALQKGNKKQAIQYGDRAIELIKRDYEFRQEIALWLSVFVGRKYYDIFKGYKKNSNKK